jgi:hypothetical protein
MACAFCMGAHSRLGQFSALEIFAHAGGGADIFEHIFSLVPITLPGDAETLREAIDMASAGGIILCRTGEHVVGARPGEEVVPGKNESGETFLVVRASENRNKLKKVGVNRNVFLQQADAVPAVPCVRFARTFRSLARAELF